MEETIGMDELQPGNTGVVAVLKARGLVRRRLMDLGLVPGTKVTALRVSPSGDLTAFYIRGTVIAIRREDSRQVLVRRM